MMMMMIKCSGLVMHLKHCGIRKIIVTLVVQTSLIPEKECFGSVIL